jgi:hypothetical protein
MDNLWKTSNTDFSSAKVGDQWIKEISGPFATSYIISFVVKRTKTQIQLENDNKINSSLRLVGEKPERFKTTFVHFYPATKERLEYVNELNENNRLTHGISTQATKLTNTQIVSELTLQEKRQVLLVLENLIAILEKEDLTRN